MKNFAEWKPHVWNSIKADYGFYSDEEEDDDDLVDFSLSSAGLEVLQPNTSSIQVPNVVLKDQKLNLIGFWRC